MTGENKNEKERILIREIPEKVYSKKMMLECIKEWFKKWFRMYKRCIKEWFKIKQSCPLCRAELIDEITK